VITWEPWLWRTDDPVGSSTIVNKINSGCCDDYLRNWAAQLAACECDVLLRFAHEFNGDWYPWASGSSADEYVPEMVRMHVDLAAGEIAANIVEHSGGGGPVTLRMEVAVTPETITATFTDNGHPTPIDVATAAMPDILAERGRGLAIAHRVLDELSYRRDRAGNHWTLVRSRAE
jgi:serine/threonine-protein kinase RsbW